jgi:Late exocytosis, associated with Golgi transport
MNSYTEDELLEYCGMDAICFLRILSMGYRICGIGALNAIFLMPIYSTASDIAIDRIVKVTVSNVEVGSSRFIATVVAAYILFGYVMFLILEVSILLDRYPFLYSIVYKHTCINCNVQGIYLVYRISTQVSSKG